MSSNPENKNHTAVHTREGPPDYTKLDAEAFPTPKVKEAGAVLVVSDTGARFRWSGTAWHGFGNSIQKLLFVGLDTNVLNEVSDAFEVSPGLNEIEVFVINTSGGSATHVVSIETSPDDVNWFAIGTIPQEGALRFVSPAPFIRANVTTAEGAASVSNVHFVAS